MQSTNEPVQPQLVERTVTLNTQELANMVPQASPDYVHHKLLMFESILFTNAKRALETGTDLGDSARIFATALRRTGGILTTIDKKTGINMSWLQEYPNVIPVVADTLQVAWKDPLDLLYIDSEHSEKQVLGELRKFGPWVRTGGIILVHDTVHNEFGQLITNALRTWCREVGLRWSEDPNPYGMGIIEVIRDLTSYRT